MEQKEKKPPQEEHFKPTGTLTLLGIYFVLIIVLWGSVYLTMLARGVTQ